MDPAARPAPRVARHPSRRGRGYLVAAAVIAAATLVSLPLAGVFDKRNVIMIYLLGVVFVATRCGRGPSILAAVGGVAVFDFVFVPPHLTFAVSDAEYLLTFAVALVVGLLVSSLAVRARDVAEMAVDREQRTQALYALSRELSGLRGEREVAAAAARHVQALFGGEAEVRVESAAAGERSREGRIVEPLVGSRGPLGAVVLQLPPAMTPLAEDERELLGVLARQIAAPLERARLADEAEQARVAAQAEQLRSTLLSSVSHDLRTPLAAITGAASALREEPPPSPAEARELVSTVLDEAERLNRLVGNLLDMTRLESGTLRPRRDWHSLEELVGTALARVERSAGEARLAARLEPDLPLVAIDAVLVEQVLVNLLENALRHGAREGMVEVSARREGREVVVEVCDEGPGFPPEAAERIFDKFHRAAGGPGAGLGLAIARAIVTAHGGSISASLREPRGACFRFTLPLEDPPAAPPPEEAA